MPGDVSLKGIEFVIKGNTTNASSSIDTLIGRLNALQKALGDTSGIKKMSTSMNGLKKAVDDFAKADIKGAVSSLKELGKVSKSLEGLANMSKDLASFARSMSKLAEKPEGLADVAVWLSKIAAIDFSGLVEAGKALQGITNAIRSLSGGSSGSGDVEKKVSVFQRIGAALKGFGISAAKGFGSIIGFPLKEAWKNASGFAKSLGGVIGGFKRILGYRMIRTIIKEITQGISEGIKNLYGWSKLIGGAVSASGETFAQSMDRITTSLAYFKNSVGAAVAPIIGALAPAIDFLIDRIVTLLNLINQLLARLAGATSWNRAIKKAQEFGGAASGAGKAAKEALAYLAPFDELNRLPADNGSGGGGGGGGADYSGLFEEVMEFNEEIADFADKVRAAIERSDWQGLGTLIGDKINEVINRIDFASLGTKVGEKINALFTTEYWTLKTINFQNIGAKIAEFLTGENGIGGALRSIDFTSIGGILAEKLTMLPDILIGFINTLDWGVVGQSIGDFIRGFLNDITEFIQGVNWAETMRSVVTGIIDFFKGLDIGEITKSVLTMLGAVVGAVAQGLGELLTIIGEKIRDPNTWALLWAWIQDLPAKFKQAGINMINALVNPVVEGINKLIERINSTGLWDHIDPIEFKLIPDIPDEELNRHYNEAKAKIEAQSKQNPINFEITSEVTKVQDKVPPSKRRMTGFTAYASEVDATNAPKPELPAKAHITSSEVNDNVKAKINASGEVKSARVASGVKAEVPAEADVNSFTTRHLSQTPSISSNGNIVTAQVSDSITKPNISSKGLINDVNVALTQTPEIDINGKITRASSASGLTTPVIDSTGKITNTTRDSKLQTPLIPANANLVGTSINAQLTKPLVNSTGNIVDTKIKDDLSKPIIDSKGKISSAYTGSNVNTPDVNANGKITKADVKDGVSADVDAKAFIDSVSGVPSYIVIPVILDTEADEVFASPGQDIDVMHDDPTHPTGHVDRLAKGGAYYGAMWHSIPKAAYGGKFHGTLFWAGEAGAEVVGHAGNRTEVLNKSQLASTMYAAVSNALHGMSIKVASPSASGFGSEDGVDEETMYRAFRRALDETDFGGDVELDGETLYRAMVQRNNSNTRMTGVNAFAMA